MTQAAIVEFFLAGLTKASRTDGKDLDTSDAAVVS